MSPGSFAVAGVLLAGLDAEAVNALRPAAEILTSFGIRSETAIILPGDLDAGLAERVCAVIVASTDAALPASLASATSVPVIRVPTDAGDQHGLALLDDGDGDLPAGGAVGGEFATMAIGEAGARNAALFVVSMLAGRDDRLRAAWAQFRARQTDAVLRHPPLVTEN